MLSASVGQTKNAISISLVLAALFAVLTIYAADSSNGPGDFLSSVVIAALAFVFFPLLAFINVLFFRLGHYFSASAKNSSSKAPSLLALILVVGALLVPVFILCFALIFPAGPSDQGLPSGSSAEALLGFYAALSTFGMAAFFLISGFTTKSSANKSSII